MTSENARDSLLSALQEYLQETDFAHLTSVDQPDLAALFSDLVGLKTEVKAESRQFKATLNTLAEAVAQLKNDNQALAEALAVSSERAQQQLCEMERMMLLDWLDIYDRLSEGYKALQHYQPVNTLFNHSKKQDLHFIESVDRGQEITLQRFEQLLKRRKVYPITCVGQPFDAERMNTIAIGSDPQFDIGIVLEELRTGFMFEDQVLRLAEVKVNKL